MSKDKLLDEGFHRQQRAADYTINSREQLEALLKHAKQNKPTVVKAPCRSCKIGWHHKIRGTWGRCNKCGYAGYQLP